MCPCRDNTFGSEPATSSHNNSSLFKPLLSLSDYSIYWYLFKTFLSYLKMLYVNVSLYIPLKVNAVLQVRDTFLISVQKS